MAAIGLSFLLEGCHFPLPKRRRNVRNARHCGCGLRHRWWYWWRRGVELGRRRGRRRREEMEGIASAAGQAMSRVHDSSVPPSPVPTCFHNNPRKEVSLCNRSFHPIHQCLCWTTSTFNLCQRKLSQNLNMHPTPPFLPHPRFMSRCCSTRLSSHRLQNSENIQDPDPAYLDWPRDSKALSGSPNILLRGHNANYCEPQH